MMDLEELWKPFQSSDSALVDTYTDAMGVEQSEEMAPFPPPSMTERGNSTINSHRLDIHTGQFKRPSKNGESIVAEFDRDMERPTKLLNSKAADRISPGAKSPSA